MGADRVHRALQQRVAGAMTMPVVDRLEADNIDVANDERSQRPTGTIDLLINGC
jgi:hypothetical protein